MANRTDPLAATVHGTNPQVISFVTPYATLIGQPLPLLTPPPSPGTPRCAP